MAIRQIDPQHIIFLEDDRYSTRFSGLEEPFTSNLVYSSHNYTEEGFGPGTYPANGRQHQEQAFLTQEGSQFCHKYNVPLWVSEFGAVYNGPTHEVPDRLGAMNDQIAIFKKFGIHWTNWTYKDTGVMGLLELDPESDYMQLIAPITRAKQELQTDSWMSWLPQTQICQQLNDITQRIEKN